MSTSVKHIHSGMRGAPTISGTAGTLIAALDAFFVSGWGITTAIGVSVSDGVATATLTSGQTFDRDSVVLVEGATPSALNGEAKVLSSSSSSITWATEAADGAATGTITIKYAPQTSWEKVYAGTNKAVYRSTDVQSHGHYLRVDDTGTTSARIRGLESMTDVDTGTGPFPSDAQMSGGGYLWKSTAANATAASYHLFSDERLLLLGVRAGSPSNAAHLASPLRGFGDPIPLDPAGDAWSTFISVGGNTFGSSQNTGSLDSSHPTTVSASSGGTYMPRDITGLGSSVAVNPRPFSGTLSVLSGADSWFGALPSTVDGQVKLSKQALKIFGDPGPLRAITPGVHFIPQTGATAAISVGDVLAGSGELAGRKMLAMGTGTAYNNTVFGIYLVDITGPWR